MKQEIYERMIKAILEHATDPALGINIRRSQFETIAEIVTEEVVNIMIEAEQRFRGRVEESVNTMFDKE